MYGLPVGFDASLFVRKELDQVCFSANTISLMFEENLLVTLMGSFIYMESLDATPIKQSVPVSSSDLMCLVGKTVCQAEGHKDGTLTLRFDDGHVLVFLDDSREYESYIIRVGGNEVIV